MTTCPPETFGALFLTMTSLELTLWIVSGYFMVEVLVLELVLLELLLELDS